MKLTVDSKKVHDIYRYNEEILSTDPTHAGALLLKHKLHELFGDECVPKPPVFATGEKVRIKSDFAIPKIYRGKVGIVSVVVDEDTFVVRFPERGAYEQFDISRLHAYEPKFRIGDIVRKEGWDKDQTISGVEWHSTWDTFTYRFLEQEYGFNCHVEEKLTLVEARQYEPKFNEGDTAKLKYSVGNFNSGATVTVVALKSINNADIYLYKIEGALGLVPEGCLEPCEEPQEDEDRYYCNNVFCQYNGVAYLMPKQCDKVLCTSRIPKNIE